MIGLFCCTALASNHKAIIRSWFNSLIDFLGEDNVVIFTPNKSVVRLKNLINRPNVKYVNIPMDPTKENWKDYYNKCCNAFEENNIDKFISFKATILPTSSYKNYGMYNRFEREWKKEQYDWSLNFVIVRNQLCRYSIIRAAAEKCNKVIQFMTDPQEPDFIKYLNIDNGFKAYILNKPEQNMIYLPSSEHDFITNRRIEEKSINLLFYGTALTEDRHYLVDYKNVLSNIPNSDIQIITSTSNMEKANNKYIPQDDYNKLLAKSKFTLIAPSYDASTFSILRFFEAIQNNCIPLVLDICNLTDVQNTFPDICDIIEKYLMVNLDTIEDVMKKVPNDLITTIYNSKSIKNLMNTEWCSNQWKKVL